MKYFKNITCYHHCNIFNDKPKYTYNKEKSLGEIIDLAIEFKYPIITKNGKTSNWEIKNCHLSTENIKKIINDNINHDIYNYDCLCFFIEY